MLKYFGVPCIFILMVLTVIAYLVSEVKEFYFSYYGVLGVIIQIFCAITFAYCLKSLKENNK